MNKEVTLQEAMNGANVVIEVIEPSRMVFIENIMQLIGSGTYAKEGNKLFVSIPESQKEMLRNIILGTLAYNGITGQVVKFDFPDVNITESLTHYTIKEDVEKDTQNVGEFMDWARNEKGDDSGETVMDLIKQYGESDKKSSQLRYKILDMYAQHIGVDRETLEWGVVDKGIDELLFCDFKKENKPANETVRRFSQNSLSNLLTSKINEVYTEKYESIKELPEQRQIDILTNEAFKRILKEGTSNFWQINSDTYYVVNTKDFEIELSDDEYEVQWDDVESYIVDEFKSEGFDEDQYAEGWIRARGTDCKMLGISLDVVIGDTKVYLVPLLVSGYYEGATIDFEILTHSPNNLEQGDCQLSGFGSTREFAEYVLDTEDENTINAAQETIDNAIGQFKKAAKRCSEEYSRQCTFSNGESIYTKKE